MQVRRFVVALPAEEFKRLRELAAQEQRAPEQQAGWLLGQQLREPPRERDDLGVVAER